MAGYGHNRFAVATPGLDSFVEAAHVMVATAIAIEHTAVGHLDKRPFKVQIDIAPYPSVAGLTPRWSFPVALSPHSLPTAPL